ncbi:MAG: 4-(cytidine 5'-diphospho)-2-C-methyl-D-erythritol kinase [Desulfamplus sp.]|nr:4-(cytidine 5'-diphospho)-2-C-methyl-D-erythritol kinase [Desulfamplus sp.]
MLIKSHAKINLFLYVTGKRDDGYHDLFSLMACIDLHDEIEIIFDNSFVLSEKPPKIEVRCDNLEVPQDESNIAFKAAKLFNSSMLAIGKNDLRGVSIYIKKKIPLGAGLGGGSSNAAAVLKAMNQFYGFPFSDPQLIEMGCQLGADVPFFIFGGAAIAEGVGERLSPLPLLDILDKKNIYILLFYPALVASTGNVYKNLDLALTKSVKSNNKCLLKRFEIKNIKSYQGIDIIKGLMHNDLESSASHFYPEIGLFRQELVDYLPKSEFLEQKVMMTGSGSTFFSLFSDFEKAQRSFNELSSKWRFTKREIFLTSFAK